MDDWRFYHSEIIGALGIPHHLLDVTGSSHASNLDLIRPLLRDQANEMLVKLTDMLQAQLDEQIAQLQFDWSGFIPVRYAAEIWRFARSKGFVVHRQRFIVEIPMRPVKMWAIDICLPRGDGLIKVLSVGFLPDERDKPA